MVILKPNSSPRNGKSKTVRNHKFQVISDVSACLVLQKMQDMLDQIKENQRLSQAEQAQVTESMARDDTRCFENHIAIQDWPPCIIYIYIYTYGRGRRFPERTSIRIIELEKKQCFTVLKWRFFMSFFSLLMSFHYGSFIFRPSKLKSIMDHHNMFFLVFLFSQLELRGAQFVLYQRSLEKGIIYCVSTGILMWCCFSLVIHSDFAYHQNFRVLWVSCFYCLYTKALVQDISTTIEGTNPTNSNVILCRKISS